MNKFIFSGRLTGEPEMRATTDGGKQFASFSVAVNRYTKEGQVPSYFDCVAFGKTGEFVARYFHKGSGIVVVDSEISAQKYEKDGKKITRWSVFVNSVEFPVGSVKDEEENRSEGYTLQDKPKAPEYVEIKSDEDLPF